MLLLSEKPVYARTVNVKTATLNAATAGALGVNTNAVDAYVAGAYGGRIESLVASSDDTAAVNIFVFLEDGSANVLPLGIVNVPASSGNSGTLANIDLLSGAGVTLLGTLIDSSGKRYIAVPPTWKLRVSVLATMTAAKKCYVTAQGFDYTALS